MPTYITHESEDSATSRSLLTVIATVVVLAAVFLIGYFAWWGPAHTGMPMTENQTVIHDQGAAPSTTIVNPPSTPAPIVIQGQAGPKGDQGNQGDQGDKGDTGGKGNSSDPPPTTTQ
jgi:hypothetical protein